MTANSNTDSENTQVTWLLNIYKQAVSNVPLLKYSWIIIAAICILALTAFFKLKNFDVFFYAILVIIISFLGFLFSYLLKTKDRFVRYLLYSLITALVITLGTGIVSFGTYIIWGKPKLYNDLFKNNGESIKLNSISDLTKEQKENYDYNLALATWCRESGRPRQALIHYREVQKIIGDDPIILKAIDDLQKQIGETSK